MYTCLSTDNLHDVAATNCTMLSVVLLHDVVVARNSNVAVALCPEEGSMANASASIDRLHKSHLSRLLDTCTKRVGTAPPQRGCILNMIVRCISSEIAEEAHGLPDFLERCNLSRQACELGRLK
jgi:hypothetical protein